MGAAIEIISGFVTNAGATLTAVTVSPGDSLTVRNSAPGSDIWLVSAWGKHATAGRLRIRSPRMHDNVNGYMARVLASLQLPLFPAKQAQRLYAQDTLILESTSGAADSSTSSLMIYYRDIPGLAARFAMPDFVKAHGTNTLTVEGAPVSSATIGTWAAGSALNAVSGQDNLKANTDYALVGMMVDTACTSVALKGPDTGNLRVGVPGTLESRELMARWFQYLSEETGLPCIPLINSANKAGTTFDAVSNTASVTVNTTCVFVELH